MDTHTAPAVAGSTNAVSPTSAAALAPVRPHDSLSFEELTRAYNFRQTSDARLVFARAFVEECRRRGPHVRALDIGCGHGLGRDTTYLYAMRPHVRDYWGIEPDAETKPPPGIFDHFQVALMETAVLPENSFDLAYSFMVMEHVADPEAFMRAVYRCLKPGGSYLFVTPNAGHYFTIIASALKRLRLDEAVLSVIKRGKKDDYHYPVQYRFNSERTIGESVRRLGFQAPEIAFLEPRGPKGYMKGPLRPVFHALAYKRTVVRNPRCLLTLLCRITKPGDASVPTTGRSAASQPRVEAAATA